jgi:hypothetical protein
MTQPVDRLQANIERVMELLLPKVMGQLACYAQWEYRVTVASIGPPVLVSGVPVDETRCPFGILSGIQVWPGAGGSPCLPAVGSIVLVRFNDGNPGKPAIVGTDPSVPAIVPDVPPAKVSVAGLLATFATGLNAGTLVAQSSALVASLTPLL